MRSGGLSPLWQALRLGRWPHDGHHVADEQRPAEGQHQPGEEVVAEEHAPRMAGTGRNRAQTLRAALSNLVYCPR